MEPDMNKEWRRRLPMRTILFFCLINTLLFFSTSFALAYSGGDGSAADPWQISTPADLVEIMNVTARTNGEWGTAAFNNFIMTNDIDAAGLTGLVPVGDNMVQFTGSFDGQNNVISNLTINNPAGSHIGLFGWIGPGGTVRNVGVENCAITARQITGGLCGENEGGAIDNCHTTGVVTISYEWGGGLCGWNHGGTIQNSHSSCTVSAINNTMPDGTQPPNEVGGFVGVNSDGATISNCRATGDVTAEGVDLSGPTDYGHMAGGFCATNGMYYEDRPGTISGCYATGDVYTQRAYAGGFVAVNNYNSHISNCYATGNATAAGLPMGSDNGSFAGGFIGVAMGGPGAANGTITRCYATGNASITAEANYVGGFAGRNQDGHVMSECYATGTATCGRYAAGGFTGGNTGVDALIRNCYSTGAAQADLGYAAGFCGWADGQFEYCYATGNVTTSGGPIAGFSAESGTAAYNCLFWNTETTGVDKPFGDTSESPEVQGLSTAQMVQSSSFDCGWDFSAVWDINEGQTYPFLRANPAPQSVFSSIPTLTEWGQMLFALILAGLALRTIRRVKADRVC